jgi:hypothetical protein
MAESEEGPQTVRDGIGKRWTTTRGLRTKSWGRSIQGLCFCPFKLHFGYSEGQRPLVYLVSTLEKIQSKRRALRFLTRDCDVHGMIG